METIKNYLETMFRNLPNTDQVKKAKQELLQMMEDKFTELRDSGISENEAVGTVISEFGNLEELAEELGIEKVINDTKVEPSRRNVTFDEVKNYVAQRKNSIILRVFSVFFFITCCTPVIIADDVFNKDAIGVILMFTFIGAGIVLSILSSSKMEDWKYLKNEPCSISKESMDWVSDEKKKFNTKYNVMHAIGVLLCALCFVPAAICDELNIKLLEQIAPVMLFVSVGVGVGLLIYSHKVKNAYLMFLNINSANTIGGTYSKPETNKEPEYKNKTVKVIMSVFWPTITCIYLIWSFLTFDFHFTWIIWPIAGVIQTMIKGIYGEEK